MPGLHNLSDVTLRSQLVPGRYGDGGGLYLRVAPSGQKSWVFRYRVNGCQRDMGLGGYPAVSLKVARAKAAECRDMRARGLDPLDEREKQDQAAKEFAARAATFKECCDAYISGHEAGWKNSKHRQQWRNTLATYVHPTFGALPVQSVDTALVFKVLEPIWRNKPETAGRVRCRVESILDWAKVRGYRDGENPARWRGHLEHMLPERSKLRAVRHHAALPFDEMHGFVAALREREGVAARALEFLILTAARTGEVLGARWPEMDEAARAWIVPADRMKAGKEHRVPLTGRALAILDLVWPLRSGGAFVFPGDIAGKPLSNMALLVLLRRMKQDDVTAHGFRSTFRDWAAERTAFPREVAEMALAHAIGNDVEAAYRRGDLFEKRRALMEGWQTHCETPCERGKLLPFSARSA